MRTIVHELRGVSLPFSLQTEQFIPARVEKFLQFQDILPRVLPRQVVHDDLEHAVEHCARQHMRQIFADVRDPKPAPLTASIKRKVLSVSTSIILST